MKIPVKVKKLVPWAKLPYKATPGSKGYDLYSIQGVLLQPGERKAVRTGLAFELPNDAAMFIIPRSGLALKLGLNLANCIGLLDADFRGECKVILQNNSNRAVYVKKGRIAQMFVTRLPEIEFIETDKLSKTERGEGGFGSTGV